MKKFLKKAFASAATCLVISSCGGTQEDEVSKIDLINEMVENSVSKCSRESDSGSVDLYKERLENVFFDVSTKNLKTIKDNNITVCMDRRLGDQETSFFDTTLAAVYYPKEKVMGLFDNGNQNSDVKEVKHGHYVIDRFSERVRDEMWFDSRIDPAKDFALANVVVNCIPGANWKSLSDFDKDSIRRHKKIIKQAPIK